MHLRKTLFCGVGPCVVPAAAQGAEVVAIEKNPDAFGWLSVNLELNRVSSQVQSFCDDAVNIPDLVSSGFDRVISPTSYGLDPILHVLASVTRKGGWIHFSTFKSRREVESWQEKFREKGLIAHACHQCGFVARGIGRYVIDLVKE
jgi:tRNA (guanine37-N1)-methyltransferase